MIKVAQSGNNNADYESNKENQLPVTRASINGYLLNACPPTHTQ